MKREETGYWIATGLFCLMLGFSGVTHLLKVEPMVEAVTGLGYPLYLMTILGVAKLLGVLALLAPGRPLLKEWAYAGFTFNLLGATLSHAFVDDPVSHTVRPAALLVLCALSYCLRPATRRLAATSADTGASPAPGIA